MYTRYSQHGGGVRAHRQRDHHRGGAAAGLHEARAATLACAEECALCVLQPGRLQPQGEWLYCVLGSNGEVFVL